MRRSAVVLVLAATASVLLAAPASARSCTGDWLALDGASKYYKSIGGPTAIREVGAFTAGTAHDMGGLHFGPAAQDLLANCR